MGKPIGWTAAAAYKNLMVRAHSYPEHAAWLKEKDDEGNLLHHCEYCHV